MVEILILVFKGKGWQYSIIIIIIISALFLFFFFKKKCFIYSVVEKSYSIYNPKWKQWCLWLVDVRVTMEMFKPSDTKLLSERKTSEMSCDCSEEWSTVPFR